MITNKTVFIVGAGASEPFKFPTGYQLLQNIYALTDSNQNDLSIYNQCGFSSTEIDRFRQDLIRSQKRSIDAFLEHRPEYIRLGKCLIMQALLGHENFDAIYSNPDWYSYIWNMMNCKFDDFQRNEISFITFNYDRTLEMYLLNCMSSLYNKSESECWEKLKSIPIVHVHGKLGEVKFDNPTEYTDFGENITSYEKLLSASKSIKIVHEDIDNDKEFEEANNLLRQATLVVLLGFGYDDNNLRRLRISEVTPLHGIKGSSFGLTTNECNALMRKYPNILVTHNTFRQALEYLRNDVLVE
jgi:hypothetical protein